MDDPLLFTPTTLIIESVKTYDRVLKAGKKPDKIAMSFDKPDTPKKEAQGRDTSSDAADYAAKLADARQGVLDAKADMTGGPNDRYAADMSQIARERADYAHELQKDEGISSAQADKLMGIKEEGLLVRENIAQQTRTNALAQTAYDISSSINKAEQDHLQASIDLADTAADRRTGELKLLALQRQQEEADLDLILATKQTGSAEWQNANARKKQLDDVYADKSAAVMRQTEGPGQAYLRELNKSPKAINESLQDGGVSALKDLNSELTDAIMGTGKLGDAFANLGKRIIASLISIALQQRVIAPIATKLLGSDGSGGMMASLGSLLGGKSGGTAAGSTTGGIAIGAESFGSLLSGSDASSGESLGAIFGGGAQGNAPGVLSFGGGRATGGAISPDRWYNVGERGPERFYPGISGTVVPNDGRGPAPVSQPSVVQLVVGAGQMFEPAVRNISGDVSVQTVSGAGRAQAMRARQTLR